MTAQVEEDRETDDVAVVLTLGGCIVTVSGERDVDRVDVNEVVAAIDTDPTLTVGVLL